MNNNDSEQKIIRNKYSPQFKDQAVERAEKDGVPQVAKNPGIAESIKNHIFEYIEIYCNRKRLHSRFGYQTPDLYEVRKVAWQGVRFFRARS